MSRGHDKERATRKLLEADGWCVVRAAGSLGGADIVALRDGDRPRIIEVKATRDGPYKAFGPADRAEILEYAKRAGAVAELCWWPLRAREPRWIDSWEWP